MAHANDTGRDEHLIAVGTDFSPASKVALERALELARETRARVLLVHVVPEGSVVPAEGSSAVSTAQISPSPSAEGKAALKGARDLAEERLAVETKGIDAQAVVRAGKPHEELAHAADAHRANLLVIGVRAALEPKESFFLGTTAERAMRHGTTPVLLARTTVRGPYKKVLVPVDVADASAALTMRVLHHVAAYTAGAAEYDVVHYVSPHGSHDARSKEHRDAVAATLAGLCKQAGLDPARTRTHAFVAEPRQGILGEVKNRQPDVIVLGTHARSGLARVLLGSVADYVIHATHGTDVMAVPPEK